MTRSKGSSSLLPRTKKTSFGKSGVAFSKTSGKSPLAGTFFVRPSSFAESEAIHTFCVLSGITLASRDKTHFRPSSAIPTSPKHRVVGAPGREIAARLLLLRGEWDFERSH